MTISGAHARPPEKTLQWEVAAATLLDRGDPAQGVREVTVTRGAGEEGRRVFADTTGRAAEAGYDFVTLRCDGRDVENWPQATGWTV
ncbi:hypothetical protein GR927_07830 [Mycolicibacterium sp. 3033]|nr:hypothetical protein [Mycolicibacterium aurantiacum]